MTVDTTGVRGATGHRVHEPREGGGDGFEQRGVHGMPARHPLADPRRSTLRVLPRLAARSVPPSTVIAVP